jgi:hypothetical protein
MCHTVLGMCTAYLQIDVLEVQAVGLRMCKYKVELPLSGCSLLRSLTSS